MDSALIRRIVSTRITYLTILMLATGLTMSSYAAESTTPEPGLRERLVDYWAFTNATVVVSPTETLEGATLVIRDGKIVDAGAEVEIPDGCSVRDLNGLYVIPGFIDPYTHYGLPESERVQRKWGGAPQYWTKRIGGNAWNEAVKADINWVDQFSVDEKASLELQKLGFTAVQTTGDNGVFRGRSCVALLGAGLPNDLILKTNGAHSLSLLRASQTQQYPESLMGRIALIRQTLLDAEWYRKAWDAYAQSSNQGKPEYNAALENLDGLRGQKVLFDGGENRQTVHRANSLASESGFAPVVVASGYEYEATDEIASLEIPLIVPMSYPSKPDVSGVHGELDVTLAQLRHWERAPWLLPELERAGVTFAITTARLKDNDKFMKAVRDALDKGLSRESLLKALTTIPASLCGVSDRCGTLDAGKLANFTICKGDVGSHGNVVYESWIAGKRQVLESVPERHWTGSYSILLGDDTLTIKITEGAHAKATLSRDTAEVKANALYLSGDRFSISVSASAFDLGVVRIDGRIEGESLTGAAYSADGVMLSWMGKVLPLDTSNGDGGEKLVKEPDSLVSRLTHPNISFGLEELPEELTVLFRNATVWTMSDDGVLEGTDVLVRDGRIVSVGQVNDVPGDVVEIDATGMHITPGIIDAHSHLAIDGDVNEGTFAITPEVRIEDVVQPVDNGIYRQLAGGVTTALLLHGSANPIGGQNATVKLKWGSSAEDMIFEDAKPTLKWALGENVKQSNWGENMTTRYPQSRMGVMELIEDKLIAAREYHEKWQAYNVLGKKAKSRTVPPRVDLILQTIWEVMTGERWVHCHTYVQSETLGVMRLAEKYGFKIAVLIHNLEGYKVADEMAAHGAASTTFSDWWAYKFEVYDAIPYNAALTWERGVLTSIKSDNVDIARRLPHEAAKAAMYGGMSVEDALAMVTINPAKQLGVEHLVGSIEVGKQADLAVWNGDPLSIYSRVEQTWIEGRKYFDREQDAAEREKIKAEREALIAKLIGSDGHKSDKDGLPPPKEYAPPDWDADLDDILSSQEVSQ